MDEPNYRSDLAQVHHAGFGQHADACAPGILALLEPIRDTGGLVLEVGCGSGLLTRHLVDAGHRVVATDASPAMLALARDRPCPEGAAMIEGPDIPWRFAESSDDNAIVRMCLALNQEDPGPAPVLRGQVIQTLRVFRREPTRGRAIVAEIDRQVVGYALLVSFWSNELGGEVCFIDELYVMPAFRCRGLAKALLESLRDRAELWPATAVAIGLEVSPANSAARQLFIRHGFVGANTTMHLRRQTGSKT